MIRRLRQLVYLGLVVFALTLTGVILRANQMQKQHGEGRSISGTHDAAVVLGAGIAPDGLITYNSRRRVASGVRLLNEGKVAYLIMSDGSGRRGLKRGAEGMADYAFEIGASREAVILELSSTSTFENILFSNAIAEDRGFESLVLITDDVHLTRAALLAQHLGMQIDGLVAADIRAERGLFPNGPYLVREALAWWLNLGKVAAWSGLGALGWTPEERSKFVY